MNKLVKTSSTSGPPPTVGKRRPRFSFSRSKDKEQQRDQHHVRTPSGRWVKDDRPIDLPSEPSNVPEPSPTKEGEVGDLTDAPGAAGEDNSSETGPQIPPWHLNRPPVQWDPSPAGSSSQHQQVGSSSSGQSHAQLEQNGGSSSTKLHHVHTPPAPVPFPVPHQYSHKRSQSHSRSKPPHHSSSSQRPPVMKHKPGSLYPMHNPIKPTVPYTNWHLRPPDYDLPPIFMSGPGAAGRVRTVSNPTAAGGIAGVGASMQGKGSTTTTSGSGSHPPTLQPPSHLLQQNTSALLGHSSSHQSLHRPSPSDPTHSASSDSSAVGPMTRSTSEPAAPGPPTDLTIKTHLNPHEHNLDLADPWGRNWEHPSPYDLGGPTAGLKIPMPGSHSAPVVPLSAGAVEGERGRRFETIATSKPKRKDPSPLAVFANTMGRSSHEHRRPSFDGRHADRPPSPSLNRKRSAGGGYTSEKEKGYISDKGGYMSASDNEGGNRLKKSATGLKGMFAAGNTLSPDDISGGDQNMSRHRSDSRIGLGTSNGTKQTFEVVGRKEGLASRKVSNAYSQRDGVGPQDSQSSQPRDNPEDEPQDGNPLISHPTTLKKTPSTVSNAVQRSGSKLIGHQKSHSHLGHGESSYSQDHSTRKLSKHKHSISHDHGDGFGSVSNGLRRFYSRDGYPSHGGENHESYFQGSLRGGSNVLGKLAKKLSFVGKSQKERDREREAAERERLMRAVEMQEREREKTRDRERAKEMERIERELAREKERMEEQEDANRMLGITSDQTDEPETFNTIPVRSRATSTNGPEASNQLLAVTPQPSASRPISNGQASNISQPSPQPRHSRTVSMSNSAAANGAPVSSPPRAEVQSSAASIKPDRGSMDPRSPAPRTRASLIRASKATFDGASPMSFDQPLSPLGRLAASLVPPKGKEQETGNGATTPSKSSTFPDAVHSADARGRSPNGHGGRTSSPPPRSESPQPLPRMQLMLTNPDAPSPPSTTVDLPSIDGYMKSANDSKRTIPERPTRPPPQIPVAHPAVPAAGSTLLAASASTTSSSSSGRASTSPTPSPSTIPTSTPSPSIANLPPAVQQSVQQAQAIAHGSQTTTIAYTDGVNTWLLQSPIMTVASNQLVASPTSYGSPMILPSVQVADSKASRRSQRPDSSVEFPTAKPHSQHQRNLSASGVEHYATSPHHGSRSAESLLPQSGMKGQVYMPMAYPAPFMLQHLPSIPTPTSSHSPLPPTAQHLPNIPTPNSSFHHLPLSPTIHSVLGATGATGPGKSHLSTVTNRPTSPSSLSSASSSTSVPPPPLPKSPPTTSNQLKYGYRVAQRPPLQPQTASDPTSPGREPEPVQQPQQQQQPPQPARRDTVPAQGKAWELVAEPAPAPSVDQASRSSRASRRSERQSGSDTPVFTGERGLELVSPRERDRYLREKEARRKEQQRLMVEKQVKREEELRRQHTVKEQPQQMSIEQTVWGGPIGERQERHRSKNLMGIRPLSTVPPTPPPKEGLRLSELPDMPSIRTSHASSINVQSRPESSSAMTKARRESRNTLTKSRPESTSTSTSASASSSGDSRPTKLSKRASSRPSLPPVQSNTPHQYLAPQHQPRPTSEGVIGIDISVRANEAMQRDRVTKGGSLVLDRPEMVEHVLGHSLPPQPPEKDLVAKQPRSSRSSHRTSQPVSSYGSGSAHTSYNLTVTKPQWGYVPAPPPNMINPLPQPPRDIDLQAH